MSERDGALGQSAAALDPARAAHDGYLPQPTSWFLKPGKVTSLSWRYTTTRPPSNWMQPGFSPSGWKTGSPGFGAEAFPIDRLRTAWTTSNLWLRTSFSVPSSEIGNLGFWGRWDDQIEIYINGVLAARSTSWKDSYRYLGITDAGRAALRAGSSNTIAVHVTDLGYPGYFDLGVTRNPFRNPPVSGFERTAALGVLSSAVHRIVKEQAIPALGFAVMKGNTVVLAKGYGWRDKALTQPLAHNAIFRHASLDKYITIGATVKLIDSGTVDPVTGQAITRDTHVFPLLAAHGLTPLAGRGIGANIDDITVGHLLQHQSGIQELPPASELPAFYSELGVQPGTSDEEDNLRWLYSQDTHFVPGSADAYSSSGMSVLRYLVHALTGDYLGYLRNTIFPLVGSSDIFLATERLSARSPREPFYATFDPQHDRWVYLEKFLATGSSAEAYVRYLRGYHMDWGTQLLDPVTGAWWDGGNNGTAIFGGAMDGTWSIAVQRRHDQVSYALLSNYHTSDLDPIVDTLQPLIDGLPDTAWGL